MLTLLPYCPILRDAVCLLLLLMLLQLLEYYKMFTATSVMVLADTSSVYSNNSGSDTRSSVTVTVSLACVNESSRRRPTEHFGLV